MTRPETCEDSGQAGPRGQFPRYNIFSIASFWWLNPLISLGKKQAIKQEDLYPLSEDVKTKKLFDEFNKYWIPGVTKSITWPLIQSNKTGLLVTTLYKLIVSVNAFVPAIVLDRLLTWLATREPYHLGFVYTAIIFLYAIIANVLNGLGEYGLSLVSLKMRSAIKSAMYQKSLRLSSDSRVKYTTGELVNLMSVDTMKIHDVVIWWNSTWSAPLVIGIATYLLWQQLGIATVAGLGFMVILLLFTTLIGQVLRKLETKKMKTTDERSKLTNELLTGMKVIKLYGWEEPFKNRVEKVRNQERRQLIKLSAFGTIMMLAQDASPILVALCSLISYALINGSDSLTASKAFVSLVLFDKLRPPLNQLPFIIQFISMYMVSCKRINDFLNCEESDQEDTRIAKDEIDEVVTIENGDFKWSRDGQLILKDINISIPKGKLIAVVGRVGSGKSSIFSAILNDMYRMRGSVEVCGSLAYVPQVAWIQNKTLKANILFESDQDFDNSRYQSIISATALEPDISILDAGDETEIGEKGINLSGGQKQRVSLARALYQDRDIYLLDDPLSAVDSHVANHIFEQVISKNGLLKDKTRILITHKINILSSTDLVIVMKDGKISEMGTYQDLINDKGDFSDLMNEYSSDQSCSSEQDHGGDEFKEEVKFEENRDAKAEKGANGKLTEKEKEEVGSVSSSVYLNYFKSVGLYYTLVVLIICIISNTFNVLSSLWLREWAKDGHGNVTTSSKSSLGDQRVHVYSGLTLLEAVTLLVCHFLVKLAALKASNLLHHNLLNHIIRAPMSFFDTTPIGRILNRFTKDVDGLDTYIVYYIKFTLFSSFKILITIIIISLQEPYFLISVIPLSIIYLWIRNFYISTSRQLNRIEASSRSPIISHFSETISGSSCIKSFGASQSFANQFDAKNDQNSISWILSAAVARWMSFRLNIIGNIVVTISVLLAVLSPDSDPASTGLSVAYALALTYHLNLLIRYSADLESNLVAAERILEYTKIDLEAPLYVTGLELPKNWPSMGSIKFENYSTRYREGLDLVLKDITFEIKPGEKVGIVGRTGSGKSSLTLALMRIIEPVNGKILIDDICITKVGLADLRSQITIIPQDPVLFNGTIRMNLDPLNQYHDDHIWSALISAHLQGFITQLEGELEFQVNEGGENFSVGQRQLFCLARALLRKSKILILDEATAAVDVETDTLIQETVKEKFNNCTILTIAHRLNTTLDYDRILVLDQGRLVEFDTPGNLLADKNSQFYIMCLKGGLIK